MTDKRGKSAPETGSAQEVDRIRDIIFGSQMQDYEQQFQMMQRELEQLQGEIDGLRKQLRNQGSEQGKNLKILRQEMREADNDLSSALQKTAQELTAQNLDRLALGELFLKLGNRFKTAGSLADVLKGLEAEDEE